jgi:limonene-1,2-epoxide hydrolase
VSNDAEAVVTAFFKAMGPPYANFRKALEDYLTEDAVWLNSGFPDCNGKEACLAFLDGFAQQTGTESLGVETLSMSSSGDTVLTERVDSFINADGGVIADLPLMGVLKVRDGKIAFWHDYFDPRPLLGG